MAARARSQVARRGRTAWLTRKPLRFSPGSKHPPAPVASVDPQRHSKVLTRYSEYEYHIEDNRGTGTSSNLPSPPTPFAACGTESVAATSAAMMPRSVSLGLLLSAGHVTGARANVLWNDVCTQPDTKDTKWCDTRAPIAERAAAFVAALMPEEKVPIMTNEAQGVKRLHIPPYQWGSEGLHGPLEPCVCGPSAASGGSVKCACPTSFPAPSAMASAFNNSLYWLVGHHDGIEARAINNLRNHMTQNNYGDGIDYWSPTVNMQVRTQLPLAAATNASRKSLLTYIALCVQRDPRWGRNQGAQCDRHFATRLR